MKALNRFTALVVFMVARGCCAAAGGQVVVHVNKEVLTIEMPNESVSAKTTQRIVVKRLQERIMDEAIKKVNIVVPQETLAKCMDLYVAAGVDQPTNFVNDIVGKSTVVIECLRRVVVDHEDKNQVYDKYLKGVIFPADWEAYLASNNTVAKIDKMESLVPHSVDDLKRFSQASLKRDIEKWLLFQKVTKGIKQITFSSDDVELMYKTNYPTGVPPLELVEDNIKAKLANRLKEAEFNRWWLALVSECQVEVPDEFESVKELLKVAPHPPLLPVSITSFLGDKP